MSTPPLDTPTERRRSPRQLVAALLGEHAEPRRLGVGVGVGVVIGCSPLFGLHAAIGLLAALALRLNKLAVVAGTQISTPPLAPLIAFGSVQLGAAVLAGAAAPLHLTDLHLTDLHLTDLPEVAATFALHWTVGGLLLGAALGALAGGATAALAHRRRRRGAIRGGLHT